MKAVLFIGGAGFIGSNLIRRFIGCDSFRLFVYEPEKANLDRLRPYADLTIIRGSLGDGARLRSIIEENGIDIVVHLASSMVPGSSFSDYAAELKEIVLPSFDLITYCAEKGIRFVLFSSGGTIYGSRPNYRFRETDMPAPISYYGLSKQILEAHVQLEGRRCGLKYLIVRPSNPYGPGQLLSGRQGLIAVSMGRILADKPITIWGDGSNVRDYICITDLAEIFFGLVHGGVENEIVNLGSGCGYSINQVIDCIRDVCNERPVRIEYADGRQSDVSSIVLDTTKSESMVAYQKKSLHDGIAAFYEYLKDREERV